MAVTVKVAKVSLAGWKGFEILVHVLEVCILLTDYTPACNAEVQDVVLMGMFSF